MVERKISVKQKDDIKGRRKEWHETYRKNIKWQI